MTLTTLPTEMHGVIEPVQPVHLLPMNPESYPHYLLYRNCENSWMTIATRFQEPDPLGHIHRRYWKPMINLYFLVSSTECGQHTVADMMSVEEAHDFMKSFKYLDFTDPYNVNQNGDYLATNAREFYTSALSWGNANGCINRCRSDRTYEISHIGGMRLRKGPVMPRDEVLTRIKRIAEYGVGR